MYNYYFIKTDTTSLQTPEIENYLRSFGVFDEEKGMFFCRKPFLDILLMNVTNPDSWSSRDYDSQETNYISIITSCFSDNDSLVINILQGLENLTGLTISSDC
ncbi:MAG: hypothetical protein K2J40_01340 [Ruminococcus sp.]|nr:hypothetical protein [Ruminococcus sp.]